MNKVYWKIRCYLGFHHIKGDAIISSSPNNNYGCLNIVGTGYCIGCSRPFTKRTVINVITGKVIK